MMDYQIKALIVEDDAIQAQLMEIFLKSLNYLVVGIADTGEKAIKMVKSRNPDLILMDIKLKGKLDGIDAAKEIMKLNQFSLIYITGNVAADYNKRIEQTSYVDFLKKPISKEILSNALFKCFI